MSPRTKKTAKKTATKRTAKDPLEGGIVLGEATLNSSMPPSPAQVALEDIEALKTFTGQLSARLDELQEGLPAQIGEARSLAISGDQRVEDRFFQAIEKLQDETREADKKGTEAHNLSVGRIDRVANHAAESHRNLIDETQRLAKRISAIDIDLDKHRRFHDAYGAEAINEASVSQGERINNLAKVVYFGLTVSAALSAFALISAMH